MFDYDPNKWGDMSSDENPEDDLVNNAEDKINNDPFYVSLTETYVDIPQKGEHLENLTHGEEVCHIQRTEKKRRKIKNQENLNQQGNLLN